MAGFCRIGPNPLKSRFSRAITPGKKPGEQKQQTGSRRAKRVKPLFRENAQQKNRINAQQKKNHSENTKERKKENELN